MATTIITKHGTGVPSSLAVGELAIDKAEPAIYTNTGTGVEKIATASSGGGGGVLAGDYETDFKSITSLISFSGTHGSKCSISTTGGYEGGYEYFTIKPTSNISWAAGQTIVIEIASTHEFRFIVGPNSYTASSTVEYATDINVYAQTYTYGTSVDCTIHAALGDTSSNPVFVADIGNSGYHHFRLKSDQYNNYWAPRGYRALASTTTNKLTLTMRGSTYTVPTSGYINFRDLLISPK